MKMKMRNVCKNKLLILIILQFVSSLSNNLQPLYELNQLKEGFSTKLKNDGAISGFSFEEQDEMKRLAEIENYSPKIRRMTQDRRFCAKAFVSDRKTYFDCTKARTPDGEIAQAEWCYVDPIYTDTRKWDYCEPILDYNRVRGAHLAGLREIEKMIAELNLKVGENIPEAQKSLEEIKKVKGDQIKVEERIRQMEKTIESIFRNLQKLEKIKQQYSEQEKNLDLFQFQIEARERELHNREIKEEVDFSIAKKTTYCKGMLLYEDEEEGDGLIGYYYDNENWLGSFEVNNVKEINFDWTNTSPLPNINPNNFSIRWEGWLYIPIQEYYTFTVLSDDGVEVYINDVLVISHNTHSVIESYSTYLTYSSASSPNGDANKKTNPLKKTSKEIQLIGNLKYKILIKYFHSVHTSVNSNGQVFLKLFWQSKDFSETIIPPKYFYTAFNNNPLKITGYDTQEAELKRLHENESAFKNSDRYIIQDIPFELLNTHVLKLKSRYTKDFLEVKTSGPTNAYIAVLSHYPNPLGKGFEDTGLSMSLLELDKNQSRGSKKLVARRSARMSIYKKRFFKGNVQINFNNKVGLNAYGIPMVVFFGFDFNSISPLICTGLEHLISISSGPFFKSCIASSEVFGYKCEDGFSGKMRDEEGGMWAAKSDGVGAWVKINFKHTFKVTKMEYVNRKNPSERNKQIELFFSSGETQIINLKNEDRKSTFHFDSVRADSVKVTIKDVYGTLNNGGAFNFYGVKCEYADKSKDDDEQPKFVEEYPEVPGRPEEDKPLDPSFVPTLFTKDPSRPIILSCYDSLSNSYKFRRIKLKLNKKIVVKCPESCAMTEIPVYGTDIYSKDSGICKAAFHNKKIPATGGLVTMIIKQEMDFYKGSLSNGIKSQGRTLTIQSVAFEMYVEEDIILLKPGSKVDFRVEDREKGNLWQPAIITKVIDTNHGKFLNLILDGLNSETFELPYPNKEKVTPCGEHVKDRECKGSVKVLQKKLPILIRFVPKNYQSSVRSDDKGYLADNGDVFGKHGKPFGWAINMENKIITRLNPEKPFLETFILFPPAPNSKSCSKLRPDHLCEPVTWRVKVGKGKFNVKVFVGDVLADRIINLKLNDKFLAYNKTVARGDLEVFEEDSIESKNEMFELSADCQINCSHAITIINAIEITPSRQSSEDFMSKQKEKQTSCGHSFTGGRCDKGPDVLHCLFDDPSVPSAKYCNGDYALASIPQDYKCKDQFGRYKCVNKIYPDTSECKMHCPKKCKDSKCIY